MNESHAPVYKLGKSFKTTVVDQGVYSYKGLVEASQLVSLPAKVLHSEDSNHQHCFDIGFFTVLAQNLSYQNTHCSVIVTDHLRSYPVFLKLEDTNSGLVVGAKVTGISDNIESLMTQGDTLSPLYASELTATGYVSGAATLINGVVQVPAATCVVIDESTGIIKTVRSLWHFAPQNTPLSKPQPVEQINKVWMTSLDLAMREATKRLIEVADGRQLVIPLSGGYDSRLVLFYLLEAGYKNLATFTFGAVHSDEVRMSKKIADYFKLPWRSVYYTRDTWKTLKGSQLWRDYLPFISQGVSVPNVQVLPAINLLVEEGFVEPDAIAVPGHSGGFVAGCHIPRSLLSLSKNADVNEKIDAVVAAVMKDHYRYKPMPELRPLSELELIVRKEINELAAKPALKDLPAISWYEAWDCKERQAKFTANSNRYFEFFDLGWWMPLWDMELVRVFEALPLEARIDKRAWLAFCEQKERELMPELAPLGHVDTNKSRWVLAIQRRLSYFCDSNVLYGLVPFRRWLLSKLHFSKREGALFGYLAELTVNYYQSLLQANTGQADKTKNGDS